MKKNRLQYFVFGVGTLFFILLVFGLVGMEKNKTKGSAKINYQTKVETRLLLKPNKESKVIKQLEANTKVEVISETKYFYKVIEGRDFIGYIDKVKLVQTN